MSEPKRRKNIRLYNYDYTQNGAYCITIVTHKRQYLFGQIDNDGVMHLNRFGEIVEQAWFEIPDHRPYVELDAFVIMPNHVHGIIVITDQGQTGTQLAAPLQLNKNVKSHSLGAIVRGFKAAASKRINEIRYDHQTPVWHRNYYEQIIRNVKMLERFQYYIFCNPQQWAFDRYNAEDNTL